MHTLVGGSFYYAKIIKLHSFRMDGCVRVWVLYIKNCNLITISKSIESLLLICMQYALYCGIEWPQKKLFKRQTWKYNEPSIYFNTLTFYNDISFSNGFYFETFLCSKQERVKILMNVWEKLLKETLIFFEHYTKDYYSYREEIKLTLCTQRMAHIICWLTIWK